jgi:hypothetical protein
VFKAVAVLVLPGAAAAKRGRTRSCRTWCKRSKRRSKINNLREKWTWEQRGNRTRRKRGKTRIRADQKARRDNNLVIASPDCKTSTPGSNPGGASTFLQQSRGFACGFERRCP